MSSRINKITSPVSEADWFEHLSQVGSYSFFQTPTWCRALCRFDCRYRDSTVLFNLEGVRVLFPLVAVRKRFGLETLESMPWGTYGGLIANRPLSCQEEMICIERVLSLRRPQLSIISWPGTTFLASACRTYEQETHRLDLSEGFESIWKHRYTPRHRTKIRKAERSGLEAIIDNSMEGVRIYKHLYTRSMKRWEGDLAYDPDFLAQWIDAPQDQLSIWLCRRGDDIMAGAIVFYSPTEAHYWSGATDLRFSKLHPSNYLLSRTVEDAIRRGCRTYNFASSAGLQGVIQFKKQFGPDTISYSKSVFVHPAWRSLDRFRKVIRR